MRVRTLKPCTVHTGKTVVYLPRYALGNIVNTAKSNGIGDIHRVEMILGGITYTAMFNDDDLEILP